MSFFSATNVLSGIWRKLDWTVGLKLLKRGLIKPKVETFMGNGTDDIFFLVHYKCDSDEQVQVLLFKLHFALRRNP